MRARNKCIKIDEKCQISGGFCEFSKKDVYFLAYV